MIAIALLYRRVNLTKEQDMNYAGIVFVGYLVLAAIGMIVVSYIEGGRK